MGRQAAHGRRDRRSSSARRRRRVDWGLHDAAVRRGSHDVPRRAAPRRHPRRRRQRALTESPLPATGPDRAATRQPAPGLQPRAATRIQGRRVPVPARRAERDGLGARTHVARGRGPLEPTSGARAPVTERRARGARLWRDHRGGRGGRGHPRLCDGAAAPRDRCRPGCSLRRDPVRIDRHHRPRLFANRCGPSAQRLGVRRATRRVVGPARRVVAVVEMGAPRARGARADARLRRRRPRSARAGSIGRRARGADACVSSAAAADHRRPDLQPCLSLGAEKRPAQRRAPGAGRADRPRADRPPAPVHHRQRLPRRRDTRLRGGRARHSQKGC